MWAAAWWNPSGSPAAAMAAAISSISPVQRQPLAAADRSAPSQRFSRPGWDRPHSSSRTGSTPSARASARAASSRAADPLVQDAYAIFTADAVPGAGTTRASTAVPPNSAWTSAARGPDRYSRVCPGASGGGPTIPPST
jgi:hypothetical protein